MERQLVQLVLEGATNHADIKIAFRPLTAERDCVLEDLCGFREPLYERDVRHEDVPDDSKHLAFRRILDAAFLS